ncbi:MAG: HAMP domain-containing sensor histidine kinase, partial [Firmicutes bacterium]|nr:HAMP domain-containing sensor histidine kinase [Bacillota bacterium]
QAPYAILEITPNVIATQDQISATFASSLMHEIRNPLAALSGYLELSLAQLPEEGTANVKDYLVRSMAEVERLSRLTQDMLWISRAWNIQPGWISLTELIDRAWSIAIAVKKSDQQVVLNSSVPATQRIWADSDRLLQVLINAFKNAIEALQDTPNAQIDVCVKDDDKEAVICIQDNGPGIPQKILKHLFERRQSTKAGGSGLGLWIVRLLMEAHRGHMAVRSNDHGAELCLQFPKPETSGIEAVM